MYEALDWAATRKGAGLLGYSNMGRDYTMMDGHLVLMEGLHRSRIVVILR